MKNSTSKLFRRKTNKLYSYNDSSSNGLSETTIGDPTNTTITILTTVSGQTHFGKPQGQLNLKS